VEFEISAHKRQLYTANVHLLQKCCN